MQANNMFSHKYYNIYDNDSNVFNIKIKKRNKIELDIILITKQLSDVENHNPHLHFDLHYMSFAQRHIQKTQQLHYSLDDKKVGVEDMIPVMIRWSYYR